MTTGGAPFRLATEADADLLATLIVAASEGLALHVWTERAGADGARAHGARRMAAQAREGGWILAEEAGRPVAGLAGHALPDPPPAPPADAPPQFRPLDELEALAPGTWYVHVLAALPEARGRGWGTRLLRVAEAIAGASGHETLSLIVADHNAGARRLYARTGFEEAGRRRMVKDGWHCPGTEWVLMLKPLGAGGLSGP